MAERVLNDEMDHHLADSTQDNVSEANAADETQSPVNTIASKAF